jgi:hypothetical protein
MLIDWSEREMQIRWQTQPLSTWRLFVMFDELNSTKRHRYHRGLVSLSIYAPVCPVGRGLLIVLKIYASG